MSDNPYTTNRQLQAQNASLIASIAQMDGELAEAHRQLALARTRIAELSRENSALQGAALTRATYKGAF